MRTLRITPPVQLSLPVGDRHAEAAEVWSGLPEATRQAALTVLARLIRAGSVRPEQGEQVAR